MWDKPDEVRDEINQSSGRIKVLRDQLSTEQARQQVLSIRLAQILERQRELPASQRARHALQEQPAMPASPWTEPLSTTRMELSQLDPQHGVWLLHDELTSVDEAHLIYDPKGRHPAGARPALCGARPRGQQGWYSAFRQGQLPARELNICSSCVRLMYQN